MQLWDDKDRDAAALVALGVGGPKLLQALKNRAYLPSYDMGEWHVEPPHPPIYTPTSCLVSPCFWMP